MQDVSGIIEDYYLTDAMGKTIAIRTNNTGTINWEYFVSGTEREARIIPVGGQIPGQNATKKVYSFETGQVSYFLYDHLGNT